MKKAFLAAASLMLIALPAYSQSSDDGGDRGSSYNRQERDLDEMLRGLDGGGLGRAGASRGAGFLLRAGDATLAVRCDPRDSMRACVEAATMLLERARAAMPSGSGPGGSPPARSP